MITIKEREKKVEKSKLAQSNKLTGSHSTNMPKRSLTPPASQQPAAKRPRRRSGKIGFTKVATGPPSLVRKLRYSSAVLLQPSTAAYNYFFSANGMFDPDITGTGHQPLGFDQYMSLYDHYKVLESKITVEFCGPTDGATSNTMIYAIYLDDDASAITDVLQAIEQGNTVWKAAQPTQVKPYKLTKKFKNNSFFASKKTSAEVVGTASANPSEQAYFNVIASPMAAGVDNPTDFFCLVTIDYTVQFSEKKTLAQS